MVEKVEVEFEDCKGENVEGELEGDVVFDQGEEFV